MVVINPDQVGDLMKQWATWPEGEYTAGQHSIQSRGGRTRTGGLCVPNTARYQLRHTPKIGGVYLNSPGLASMGSIQRRMMRLRVLKRMSRPTSYHMCERRGRGQIMRNKRNLAQLRRSGVRSRCGGLEFNGRCSRTARLTAAHNGDEQFSLRNRVATAKIDHPKPDAESGRIL